VALDLTDPAAHPAGPIRPAILGRHPQTTDRGMPDATSRDMTPQHQPTLLGMAPAVAHAPRTAMRRYRIVVGIDLSEYADIVIEHALDQAARHDLPELHFLTVREKRRPSGEEVKRALWERVYPSLEAFNRHGTDWRAQLHVQRGKPEVEIAELAADIRADLIVIGQFGLHTPRARSRRCARRWWSACPARSTPSSARCAWRSASRPTARAGSAPTTPATAAAITWCRR
jgi:nucleotide-binding universal stress UspA family protein